MSVLKINIVEGNPFATRRVLRVICDLTIKGFIGANTQVMVGTWNNAHNKVRFVNLITELLSSFPKATHTIEIISNGFRVDVHGIEPNLLNQSQIIMKFGEYQAFKSFDEIADQKIVLYLSGYQPRSPEGCGNVSLVGPKWWWSRQDQCILSGVNFLHILAENENIKNNQNTKNFDVIMIGSSTLNKNLLFGSFIIFLSQLIKRFKGDDVLQSCIIFTKYPSRFGSFLYYLNTSFLVLLKILGFKCKLITGKENNLTHSDILSLISSSSYVFVPYMREGFPRVLGEAVLVGTVPIVGSWIKFGSENIDDKLKRYGVLSCVLKLASQPNKHITHEKSLSHLYDRLFYTPKLICAMAVESGIVSDFEPNATRERVMSKCVYYLLTADDSWF